MATNVKARRSVPTVPPALPRPPERSRRRHPHHHERSRTCHCEARVIPSDGAGCGGLHAVVPRREGRSLSHAVTAYKLQRFRPRQDAARSDAAGLIRPCNRAALIGSAHWAARLRGRPAIIRSGERTQTSVGRVEQLLDVTSITVLWRERFVQSKRPVQVKPLHWMVSGRQLALCVNHCHGLRIQVRILDRCVPNVTMSCRSPSKSYGKAGKVSVSFELSKVNHPHAEVHKL